MIRFLTIAASFTICLSYSMESAAVDPLQAKLANFAASRERIALDLSEPIAACVIRKDTAHPAFHGCVDWHSSVHGAWALVAYTRLTGDDRFLPLLETILKPRSIAAERRYLQENPTFEMPYGRAWFLRLALEHHETLDSDLLLPFADEVAESIARYYTEVEPDPMSREYKNASWALINLYDYGKIRKNDRLTKFVEIKVKQHFISAGQSCPISKENEEWPDFMAVCSTWAWLVQKVQSPRAFRKWLEVFLPAEVVIKAVASPKTVHHNGMNFSRAWGFWNLYRGTNDSRFLAAFLEHFAAAYSRPESWKGDYRKVGHWVAQFGMLALMVSFYDWPPDASKAGVPAHKE